MQTLFASIPAQSPPQNRCNARLRQVINGTIIRKEQFSPRNTLASGSKPHNPIENNSQQSDVTQANGVTAVGSPARRSPKASNSRVLDGLFPTPYAHAGPFMLKTKVTAALHQKSDKTIEVESVRHLRCRSRRLVDQLGLSDTSRASLRGPNPTSFTRTFLTAQPSSPPQRHVAGEARSKSHLVTGGGSSNAC